MTKLLRILGTLLALLVLCPASPADTYSPTYAFSGVITGTGTNPTCGASSSPCVETIDASFEYYYDVPPGFTLADGLADGEEAVDFVPGTSSFSASGDFGSLTSTSGFFENDATFYYLEFFFPGGAPPGPSYNEIDLDLDPVANTFSSESYFCYGECQTLFGGDGGNFSVPTTLAYTVTPIPEPPALTLFLCGIFFLGVLHFASQAFRRDLKAGREYTS
jgi:hypothetical protein